jgi:hypothetical protein
MNSEALADVHFGAVRIADASRKLREVGKCQQRKYRQPRGDPFGLISSLHGGGHGRRESGHRATPVPAPVSGHTDMVRPHILR